MRDVCKSRRNCIFSVTVYAMSVCFLIEASFENILCSHLSIWATPKHSNSQRPKDPNTKNLFPHLRDTLQPNLLFGVPMFFVWCFKLQTIAFQSNHLVIVVLITFQDPWILGSAYKGEPMKLFVGPEPCQLQKKKTYFYLFPVHLDGFLYGFQLIIRGECWKSVSKG